MNKNWNSAVCFIKGSSSRSRYEFGNGPFEGKAVIDAPLEYLVYIQQKKLYFPRNLTNQNIISSCIDSKHETARD